MFNYKLGQIGKLSQAGWVLTAQFLEEGYIQINGKIDKTWEAVLGNVTNSY